MYCLPRARAGVLVESVDDLLPLVVVDIVALEVEVSPMTVVSCAENDTYCDNCFTFFLSRISKTSKIFKCGRNTYKQRKHTNIHSSCFVINSHFDW